MDYEQRRSEFEREYKALVEKHGVVFLFEVGHRIVGPQHQLEPVVSIVPVDGWADTAAIDEAEAVPEKSTSNGK